MKFQKYGDNLTHAQSFDREKITAIKCGQKYNVYDAIQAANIDTDINEVLKKYHCSTDTALEIMKQKGGIEAVYSDVVTLQENLKTGADLIMFKEKLDEQFYNLPVEMREKFGHNPKDFLEKATKYLKEQQEKNVNGNSTEQEQTISGNSKDDVK